MKSARHASLAVVKPTLYAGFSAIELLVVVGILAVLGSLAGPSFLDAIDRYRVNAIRDELVATIQLARMESIRRGAQVSMRKTTGTACSTNDDWSCGYRLFVDTDSDGVVDTGEVVLQTLAVPTGYSLMHPSQGTTLRMNVWGQAQNTGNKFVIAPPTGVSSSATKAICLSTGGRIRSISASATCT